MCNKRNEIKCVVFDLDGTLFSSHETIYYSTLKTFEKLGMKVEIPKKKFYDLIGHHFTDMFDEMGISGYDFEEFIQIYKKIYFEFIDLSKPYPGMEETIDKLKSSGVKIGLLTTKSQGQAEKILAHFNLIKKFDGVMGRREGLKHKPAPDPLLVVLKEMNCDDASFALMVGDSELDIQCGKAAGAKTAGVTFGYRSRENLQAESPDYLIDNLPEIISLVNGYSKR
jgi:HAD superfamily hydrolase (TIGR01549 family)